MPQIWQPMAALRRAGCKLEPQKIPPPQLQLRQDRIQVDHLGSFSRMCRQAAGEICVISASALVLPLASIFVSRRDMVAEL
jgi:hypothetical protein